MGQIDMILIFAVLPIDPATKFELTILPSIRATNCHMRNGSTVTYDGHTFHLPPHWYPDPNSRPNELDLIHTTFGAIDFNTVHLSTTPRKLDDDALQEQFAKMVDMRNERSNVPHEWAPETLEGRKLRFHCMANNFEGGALQTLICQAVDSNLQVGVILGSRHTRTDALNILETSE